MKYSQKRPDKVRLTLEVTDSLNKELDLLADSMGRSKAEMLRLAVDMLAKAKKAQDTGMTVGAWKDDPESKTRSETHFVGYF